MRPMRSASITATLIANLCEFVGQTVTLNGHTIRTADLLNVTLHDDVAELFIKLHGVADAVGLLTGNERRAGATEGVKHHAVAHRRIHDGIRQNRDRLHGRMVTIFLGLIEFPDGSFLPAGVPLVLTVFLPTVQTGFVLPLVRRAPQHKGLLFPDATAGQIKTRIGKCPAEVQSLGICVEHIDRSIVRHCGVHLRVRIQEEVIKGIVCHVVVFDFACAAFVVDVVRRVGDDQVGFGATHQKVIGFSLGAVTADQTVATECPDITVLGHGGLFQFCAYIEIIIFDTVLECILEQVIDLGRLETSEGNIEVSALQVSNEQSKFILVPITADFVKGNVSYVDINNILPEYINVALKEGSNYFNTKIPGFNEGVIIAPETRTSSPVRIVRGNSLESNIKGIYPCGEGSGYAGGITTSAMDGIKVAEEIAKKYSNVL